jgi:transposase
MCQGPPTTQPPRLMAGIPGVDRIVAWHLIAEMGADMSVFPDADHCSSWAGLRSPSTRAELVRCCRIGIIRLRNAAENGPRTENDIFFKRLAAESPRFSRISPVRSQRRVARRQSEWRPRTERKASSTLMITSEQPVRQDQSQKAVPLVRLVEPGRWSWCRQQVLR